MKVLLLGATGVIGRPLRDRLIREGHEVTAMTRSPARAESLRAAGTAPVVGDALDAVRLTEIVRDCQPDVVVNQLTDIPKRLNPRRIKREMAQTNRLRVETSRTLVDAARAAGVPRVISQSISFVYDPAATGLATEDEPLYLHAPAAFADFIRAVHASEQTLLDAQDIEAIVLRYGYFYGPGTVYAEDGGLVADVRRRRVPIVGDGGGVCSFVHVDDVADATVRALDYGERGVYNIVDDEPAPVRDWLPELADVLGAPSPLRVPKLLGRLGAGPYGVHFMTRQRGASNEKAKRELGWAPRWRSWRDGFRAELGSGGGSVPA